MATTTKTWTFASDAEGLADAANNAFLDFAWDSGDAAVVFSTARKGDTMTEYARNPSTGETWATWGVPAGNIITDLQITAWQEKTVSNTKLSSHSIAARVIDSGGTSVHSAGDLLSVSLATGTDSVYQSGSPGTSRAVDAAKQAIGTDVRLELQYDVTTSGGGGSAAVDQRFDAIELTITYETAPAATRRIFLT